MTDSFEETIKAVRGMAEDRRTVLDRPVKPAMIDAARFEQYMDHALKGKIEKYYNTGWNDALERAALKLEADFRQAFGADTCASWATWLKEQKR